MRGSITKRGDRYCIRYRDAAGRQRRKTFRTRGEAQKELNAVCAAVDGGTYQAPAQKVLFSDLAAKWLTYKKATTRARTAESYQIQLDKRILPTFGPLWIGSITREMVRDWEADLLGSVKSPTTAGHTVTVLKSVLNMAVEDGHLIKSPAAALKKPKREKAKVDFLNADEIKALLAATDKRDHALMLTACVTGIRRGELLGLTWGNVDFLNGRIYVTQSLQGGRLVPPKSEESKRAIPIKANLIEALRTHQARQAVEIESNDLDLVFLSPEGKPWDGGNMLHRVFQPALRRAGLRHIRFHDLRHSFCVLLLSEGKPIKSIQKLMGHHSIQVTMDIYGDVIEGVADDAIDALEAAIFDTAEKPLKTALL